MANRLYEDIDKLQAQNKELYEALKELASVCREVSYTHTPLLNARKILADYEAKVGK